MGVPVWAKKDGQQQLLRWRKSPMVGVADILGVSKLGQFFAIEVKRPGGEPSPEQIQFLNEVRQRKGIAIVADNLDDVIKTGL
jgi:RecB family endonuclease NucS